MEDLNEYHDVPVDKRDQLLMPCRALSGCGSSYKLKLIDRLRATCWTPPDYWQTDNSNGLVMVIRNYHWRNWASRVLISTCSAPLVQNTARVLASHAEAIVRTGKHGHSIE